MSRRLLDRSPVAETETEKEEDVGEEVEAEEDSEKEVVAYSYSVERVLDTRRRRAKKTSATGKITLQLEEQILVKFEVSARLDCRKE